MSEINSLEHNNFKQIEEMNNYLLNQSYCSTISNNKNEYSCTALAINKDDTLLVCGSFGIIEIFSLINGNFTQIQILFGHDFKRISSIKFSKQQNTFISGCWDYTIRIWIQLVKKQHWQCQCILEGHFNLIYCVLLGKEDEIISTSEDCTIAIWEFSGKQIQLLELQQDDCMDNLDYNQNESLFLSTGLTKVIVWEKDQNLKIWQSKQIINYDEGKLLAIFIKDVYLVIQDQNTNSIIFYKYNNTIQLYQQFNQFNYGSQQMSINLEFPIIFQNKTSLLIFQYCQQIILMKIDLQKNLSKIANKFEYINISTGLISNDGQFLMVFDVIKNQFEVKLIQHLI